MRPPNRPKLETVAKSAGVSTATASQVMRGTGRISEKTRERVLQAAQILHYVPDGRAAAMRTGMNREIGFSIHQISNPFNAEVISGVSDFLENEGYLVSVLDSRNDANRQGQHLETFVRNARAGVLWVPAVGTAQKRFDLLAAYNIPTVTFLRRADSCLFDHVGIRNAEATALATNHLADLGHRHIAYLGGTDLTEVRQDRIAGYCDTLGLRGLGAGIVWDSADNKVAGMNALLALYKAQPHITAVVCNGDMVALGACLALAQLGLVAGRDMSIIGFDDIEDAAVATPALSTMAVSPYQLGRKLARVMLERITDPTMPVACAEVSAKLILRGTTGKVPI